jgi:hypothetical protein
MLKEQHREGEKSDWVGLPHMPLTLCKPLLGSFLLRVGPVIGTIKTFIM